MSTTFVRDWMRGLFPQLATSTDLGRENLFLVAMRAVTLFGDAPEALQEKTKGRGMPLYFAQDTVLFELGCYMLFRLDLWLYSHKEELRSPITQDLQKRFCTLFAEAFAATPQKISQLLFERQSIYSKLVREHGFRKGVFGLPNPDPLTDSDTAHWHLSELILLARDAAQPQQYQPETHKMSLDMMSKLDVAMPLRFWDIHMMTSVQKSLKQFCTNIGRTD